jgi:hypothetical protein
LTMHLHSQLCSGHTLRVSESLVGCREFAPHSQDPSFTELWDWSAYQASLFLTLLFVVVPGYSALHYPTSYHIFLPIVMLAQQLLVVYCHLKTLL